MTAKRWAAAAAALTLGVGCGGPNLDALRWRASHDLDCPEDKIVLTPLDEDGDRWGLRACGKDAAYTFSSDSGKDEWVMVKKPVESPAPASSP